MRRVNKYKSKIEQEEINKLPVKKFGGDIYIIDSTEAFNEFFPLIEKEKILGFDTETRPTFTKGRTNSVALIQLSSEDKCFLFRLNKIGIPQRLLYILQSEQIKKIGVALKDDLNSLNHFGEYSPAGFIDLQQFVKNYGIEDNGLKKLTANILGFKISKRQQTSNWEQEELTDKQIEYAATDAWVCQKIYRTLMEMST